MFWQSQAFATEKRYKEEKARISKSNVKNAKFATLHATSDCMRPLLLGRCNCCVTRSGYGPSWLSEENCVVHLVICLQFLAYYLILLELQSDNFLRACTISREALSWFPHFLQPWWQHWFRVAHVCLKFLAVSILTAKMAAAKGLVERK